jgi:hypothetical protein
MFVNRITRTAAVALAILATGASVAVARPADHVEGYTLPHDFQSADSRDDAQPQTRQDFRSPDTVDAANGRGAYNSPEVIVIKDPQPTVQPTADGLDWADAGIGAGSLLAVSLIALGGGLLVVQRRGGRQLAG